MATIKVQAVRPPYLGAMTSRVKGTNSNSGKKLITLTIERTFKKRINCLRCIF